MKFFMGSEVQADISEDFQVVQKEVEHILEVLEVRNYGVNVEELGIIPIVVNLTAEFEDAGFFKERVKYSKKNKDSDIRLRILTEPGIHPEVKRACLEFAKWLRLNFEFPIRVPVYLKKDYQIKSRYTKEMVSATFLVPFDKTDEPYIRISTGDYIELLDKLGQDYALGAILGSIAHELGHYYQWIDDLELDEEGADNNREYMLDLYRETREQP